jgi:hypothetical protein
MVNFVHREGVQYSLNINLGGPTANLDVLEKSLFPLMEFEPPIIHLVPNHYTDHYAITAPHASNGININMSYILNTE